MPDIVTIDQIRSFLGHSKQEKKDLKLISLLKDLAEGSIQDALLYNYYTQSGTLVTIHTTSYDEYFDVGNQQTHIFLPTGILPVTTLTSVIENSTTLTENTDFELKYDIGALVKKPTDTVSTTALNKELLTDYWYPAQRAVRVQWTAGYTSSTMPNAIKNATLQLIRSMYFERDPDIQSRSSAGVSWTKEPSKDGLPNSVFNLIKHYRRKQ